MELTALAGNAQIKAQLAHREGDLAHAYIVAGPAGSGRHTLAAQMAAALVCSAQPQLRPCAPTPMSVQTRRSGRCTCWSGQTG